MNSTKTKGRPKHGRSPEENKEWLKARSKLYYADPINKEAQKLKMRINRAKNKSAINERARACRVKDKDTRNEKACRKRRLKTLDQRLKVIWLIRGLIVGKEN
jgi:hypothetical protein